MKRPTLTTLANFLDPSDGLTKNLCRNATTGSVNFAQQSLIDHDNNDATPDIPGGAYNSCAAFEGTTSNLAPFEERFFGDTWMPRVSIGAGVNWNSPFGPFRIDFAYALRKEEGDDTKRFSFNVGTQF